MQTRLKYYNVGYDISLYITIYHFILLKWYRKMLVHILQVETVAFYVEHNKNLVQISYPNSFSGS